MNKTAKSDKIIRYNSEFKLTNLITTGHWYTKKDYVTVRDKGTNDWLIIYTVNGSGRITFKDDVRITKPGDIILWSPGTPHDYRYYEGDPSWEIIWAHFLPWPHWHSLLNFPQFPKSYKHLFVADHSLRENIQKLLIKMHLVEKEPFVYSTYAALNALEEVLILCATINPLEKVSRIDVRIKKAIEYLSCNYAESLSVSKMSEMCHLSESRFSHLFKEETGLTPGQLLDQQRMKQAEVFLNRSSFTISEISEMLGFDSQFYFTRRFTKHTGMCPRDYRKKRI